MAEDAKKVAKQSKLAEKKAAQLVRAKRSRAVKNNRDIYGMNKAMRIAVLITLKKKGDYSFYSKDGSSTCGFTDFTSVSD